VITIAVGDVTEALIAEFPLFSLQKTSVFWGLVEAEETLVHVPVSFISCL